MKKGLLLLGAFGLILGMFRYSPYYTDKNTPTVQLIHPYTSSVQDAVVLHGAVTDQHPEKLYAKRNSRVLASYAEEGDPVEAGQLLLTLEVLEQDRAEQTSAAVLLTELQESLQSGDIERVQMMLEDAAAADFTMENLSAEPQVYNLYSPCSGVVIYSSASVGETVTPLLPCIEISNPEQLQIDVTAGEDVIALLQEGMQCVISIPAFSLDQIPGELCSIAPYAQKTGIFTGNPVIETTVSLRPLERSDLLRPGYRATAKIYTDRREHAVLLPYEAVMQDDTGEYVYKLQGSTLFKQPVICGSELEAYVEICSGITEGDLVVLNPQDEWEGKEIHFAVS